MGIDISAKRSQRGCVLAKFIYGCNYSDLPEEVLVSDDIDLSVYVTPHVS